MSFRMLSAEFQKIAEKELNEDPKRIAEDLEHLKDWLKQQHHLTTRTDDDFLLCFLRSSKFSLQSVKRKLDLFYIARTTLPEYFRQRDPFLPEIQLVLMSGGILPLPKTNGSTGPRIILIRFGACDPVKMPYILLSKVVYMMVDILLQEDENTMISGLHLIFDYLNFPASYALQFTPNSLHRSAAAMQTAYPIRIKGVEFINIPGMFDTLFPLLKLVATPKIRQRMHVYTTSNLPEMFKYLPQDLLPMECGGGTAVTIAGIRDTWKKKVESYGRWFEEDAQYGCDETLRPDLPDGDTYGVEGTFRKLNFD